MDIENEIIMDDIIITEGYLGRRYYDDNDIGLGVDVMCVNNPKGYGFTEDGVYHINGMGGLVVDEDTGKYRIGFGKTEQYGYCLERSVYSFDEELSKGDVRVETFYILYDDLIRNFIYASDTYDDPTLLPRLKRDKFIDKVLKNE